MSNKKVLIITYYWPPGGGAGVQRWLKFVKYLRDYGWTPIVYTPENGEMPVIDDSLMKDVPHGTTVLKTPIWEPYNLYKKFVGAGKDEKINTGFLTDKKRPGLAERLSVWLRGNLFIPDARCYWIKPSVKYLSEWLKNNKVDAIVSTGPPHSMHLIAMPLSRDNDIPWLADFRDPWTNIDYYKDLKLTARADKKHHQLEKDVVTGANAVVVVSNGMKDEFVQKYKRDIHVITNGFDTDDHSGETTSAADKFVIAHVGTLVRSRNPVALWKALSGLTEKNPALAEKLEIRLTGKVDVQVKDAIKQYGLDKYVKYINYLPHDQVAGEQQRATLLLLILNNTPNAKGILTGKLFEYMAAGRPVLCIGPVDGDAAHIIRETETGKTFNFNDEKGMEDTITEYFNNFNAGRIYYQSKNVDQYSRKNLTGKMAEVLEKISVK